MPAAHPAMPVLNDLVTLGRQTLGDTRRLVRHSRDLITLRAVRHPEDLFAALRAVRPVFVLRGMAIVTRFDDVVEVLARDADFTVDGYAAPMRAITGDFILGLDQGPHYERDASLLRLAFRQSDVGRLGPLLRSAADAAMAVGRRIGRLDVVPGLCDVVPTVLCREYLGVPGPDGRTLVGWARAMFADIFANPTRDPLVTRRALEAGEQVRPYLDDLIGTRKREIAAGGAAGETVLDRLLAQQVLADGLSDEEIRNNLIGLFVGMIPTTSKAAALALDELLRRPAARAGAAGAVRAGNTGLLLRYTSEAMRLNPQAPGLIRHTARNTVVAAGTRHATRIPAGTTVFASTQAAMLDPEVVDDPDAFRIDRPDHVYLHHGTGLHQCFGRFVNQVSIPAVLAAVLSVDGVQRAAGPAGRLAVDGNFPVSMTLTMPVAG